MSAETIAQVRDYAEYIGLDIHTFPSLLWIAEEGLNSPLPNGWRVLRKGEEHYFRHDDGRTQTDHPNDPHYRALGEREMQRLRDALLQQQQQQQAAAAAAQRQKQEREAAMAVAPSASQPSSPQLHSSPPQQQRAAPQQQQQSHNNNSSSSSIDATPSRNVTNNGHQLPSHSSHAIAVPSSSLSSPPAASGFNSTVGTPANTTPQSVVPQQPQRHLLEAEEPLQQTRKRSNKHKNNNSLPLNFWRNVRFSLYLFFILMIVHVNVSIFVWDQIRASSVPSSSASPSSPSNSLETVVAPPAAAANAIPSAAAPSGNNAVSGAGDLGKPLTTANNVAEVASSTTQEQLSIKSNADATVEAEDEGLFFGLF